ncbi:hypothetical protein BDV06DRAFT_199483 [Aspergillus oleicola]
MDVHGASVSAGHGQGWYTFTNLGPLTTTYTAAPSCTGSDNIALGYMESSSYLWLDYQVQCTKDINPLTNCVPTTTEAAPEPTFTGSTDEEYDDYLDSYPYYAWGGDYYSPGVFCPSGWETIGMASRDGSGKLTSSGAFIPTTTTTTTTSTRTRILITGTPTGMDYDDYYDYYDDYYEDSYDEDIEDSYTEPVSLLMTALEPSQTMALCCPSGYTTDAYGTCYSAVKDYKPSYGCTILTDYDYDYTEVPYTYTRNYGESYAIVRTGYHETPTATITALTTYTTTIDSSDRTAYTGYMYAPAITIIHHESDVRAAHEAEESAAAAKNATETPTNAARRLAVRASVWDGLGSVLGIWGVAVAVGAAIVLPW